ncbi:B12-binding domain/radical SAM domain protein, family [Sedimentisphaera cyanobacteriorum]|uniref:B12-binding domain/radical SAM domain protein, family n=1 Tax=Sedimentisphaera cyanobacteriorum TaxID=1940790 RepID=A0A1Q2HNG1_9BACT|nr:radical SAM protein [Sedimentisphaera cyanobacteriorum]AQQ08794.1 B12-binding domain/radical SAM domain protein, family [Sedimentisphaera cyanobacteriorum]
MARKRVIIDCYTDEPAGLGVPPFLGTHPRIVFGELKGKADCLTIDDLRVFSLAMKLTDSKLDPPTGKTRIDLLNRTRSPEEVKKLLSSADQIIAVAGLQTPGKYLAAQPAGLKEISRLLKPSKATKILTGPAASVGTQQMGGFAAEMPESGIFNHIREYNFDNYEDMQASFMKGAGLLKQIPSERIIEIETGRGCSRRSGCSFCTEPLKQKLSWRSPELIIEEVKELNDNGASRFRLGKQSCIYSYMNSDPEKIEQLLSGIKALKPSVFHIDNANPAFVNKELTELFVKYLTPGSTAAMGAETFDPEVCRLNNLNSSPENTFRAAEIINQSGRIYGDNGMPALLPGINILLGLEGETERTLELNLLTLKNMLEKDLFVRRINIRQVVPFPGTMLYERAGDKYLRKNKHLYSAWARRVREEIDLPMLKRIFPEGHKLYGLLAETHEGNVTFLRHLGSYPIIVGIRQRLQLGRFYDAKITGHMLRSLTGELI